jgi:uncharacterized protein (TIGR03066 family)
MFVRLVVASSVFLGAVCSAAAADEQAEKIVGVWRPAKSEDTIEFTKDGKITVKRTIGGKAAEFQGTYAVKDGKISTTLTFRGETNPQIEKFVFAIKKLTEKELIVEDLSNADRKGKPETYTRATK